MHNIKMFKMTWKIEYLSSRDEMHNWGLIGENLKWKASKLQTLQENNLLVQLEDAGDIISHQFNSHISDFHGTEF
jgi:hypothetical protein